MMRLFSTLHVSSLFISTLTPFSSAAPTHPSQHKAITSKNRTSHSIIFSSCAPELGFPPNLQCANFSVPIDWDHPDGEHFDLGLVKLAAPANSTTKIGTLFVNPGGPGAPASALVAAVAGGALQSPLLDTFDWIGLDPRGVGLSKQVECDLKIYAERVSLFPTTQEQFDQLVDKNKRLGESCRNLTGPLLEHLDTIRYMLSFPWQLSKANNSKRCERPRSCTHRFRQRAPQHGGIVLRLPTRCSICTTLPLQYPNSSS